jgi:hypothetical protein
MIRAKWAALGIVAVAAIVGTGFVARTALWPFGGNAPEQPVPFPHDLHAGTNQIPCMYCHYSADRSVSAGIPAVQVCVGCHMPGGVPLVRADSPGVRLLAEYWRQQLPIPWVRVYDLPDHVRFPHMMHVSAGVECQECHGPVETMRVVRQESNLQMGWCINCHTERGARIDCFVCHY